LRSNVVEICAGIIGNSNDHFYFGLSKFANS
jgi:hypothetical protein